jgi:type IV secretory pathway protease TraF
MVPVLPPGTLVVGIFSSKYKPGDVVIIHHDGKEKIKRISEIKDSQIFVLGDHPESSTDSRHFGWIDVENIQVKVRYPKT